MNAQAPKETSTAATSTPTSAQAPSQAQSTGQAPVPTPGTTQIQSDSGFDPVAQSKEFNKRFSQLSKKEADLVKAEQVLRAQMNRASQAAELADLAQKNPLEFLKRQGKDVHSILEEHVRSTQSANSIEGKVAAMEDRIGQLTQALENERKFRLEVQERENRQQLGNHIKTRLSAAGDKFELLMKAPQGLDATLELCKNYYGDDSSQWPIEEAAGLIEAELEKQASQLFETYQGTKKLSKYFVPQLAGSPSAGTAPAAGHAPKVRYASADVLDNSNRIEDDGDNPSAADVMGLVATATSGNPNGSFSSQEPTAHSAPSTEPQKTEARPTTARNNQVVHYKPALPPLEQSDAWERAKAMIAKSGFTRPVNRQSW